MQVKQIQRRQWHPSKWLTGIRYKDTVLSNVATSKIKKKLNGEVQLRVGTIAICEILQPGKKTWKIWEPGYED
jgi:hypothetical protein